METLPPISPWLAITQQYNQVIISENQPLVCMDASSLTGGTIVRIIQCNTTTSQTFSIIPHNNGYVFALDFLCAELGNDNIVRMNPCRNTYFRQIFQVGENLVSNGYCLGPVELYGVTILAAFSSFPCTSTIPVSFVPSVAQRIFFPTVTTELILSGGCIDGRTAGMVNVTTCDGSPEQDWYFVWGQIRNVATGQCLDAKNSNPLGMTPLNVQVSACTVQLSQLYSQLWIIDNGKIKNGVSGNCMYNGFSSDFRTSICGEADQFLPYDSNVLGSLLFEGSDNVTICQTSVIRKDFRDLAPEEKNSFLSAMAMFRTIPSLLGRESRYHDYTMFHGIGQAWYHMNPMFLLWHRQFVSVIELDIQVLLGNYSFAFPYWSWGSDAASWFSAEAEIFTTNAFGTTGKFNKDGCVLDGLINGWTATDSGCVKRFFDPTMNPTLHESNPNVLYTDVLLLTITQWNPLTSSPYFEYDSFRNVLELMHNQFHGSVGSFIPGEIPGSFILGHMRNVPQAVNDPIFFLHHGNIDRYLTYFQAFNPELTYNGERNYPPRSNNIVNVTLSDILPGFNMKLGTTWNVNTGNLCYNYQAYSKSLIAIREMPNFDISLTLSELAKRVESNSPQDFWSFNSTLDKMHSVIQYDPLFQHSDIPSCQRTAGFPDLDVNMLNAMGHDIETAQKLHDANLKIHLSIEEQKKRILAEYFQTNIQDATPQQYAYATKIAMAKIMHPQL